MMVCKFGPPCRRRRRRRRLGAAAAAGGKSIQWRQIDWIYRMKRRLNPFMGNFNRLNSIAAQSGMNKSSFYRSICIIQQLTGRIAVNVQPTN